MTNEELLLAVEKIINSCGFTLNPYDEKPGALLTEGVSYIRADGELVSVTPVKLCFLPVSPSKLGKSLTSGNAVVVEADRLEQDARRWYDEEGMIFDGFRLSCCHTSLLRKLARSEWVWCAWKDEQMALTMHPRRSLTDLLSLLVTPKGYHDSSLPLPQRVVVPHMLASLFDIYDTGESPQSYEHQQEVWHLCGQKIFLHLHMSFLVSDGVVFLDPDAVQVTWYDSSETPLHHCPACHGELSSTSIRWFPLW